MLLASSLHTVKLSSTSYTADSLLSHLSALHIKVCLVLMSPAQIRLSRDTHLPSQGPTTLMTGTLRQLLFVVVLCKPTLIVHVTALPVIIIHISAFY